MFNRDSLIKKEKKIIKNNLKMIQDILEQRGFKVLLNENDDSDILFIIPKLDYNYNLISTLSEINCTMNLEYIILSSVIANNTYLIKQSDIYAIFNSL